MSSNRPTAEHHRLAEDALRNANWKRWGPYLSDRQWGTVREDYSDGGACWEHLSHDDARSRAYRWGEDGLLGFSDRECRLCLAPTIWNGKDPILKERLFGLTNAEGNHGEDVKEHWWHLAATPTASYALARYRYPLDEYPYAHLVQANRGRSRDLPEFELEHTGIFDAGNFVDVEVEWAKAAPDDLCWIVRLINHSDEPATLQVLPTAWFRNTWSWGCSHEGCTLKPSIRLLSDGTLALQHETLGRMRLAVSGDPQWLFTDNETNYQRLYGTPNDSPWVKDAFHRRIIDGELDAVNPKSRGTKAAAWFTPTIPSHGTVEIRLRLRPDDGLRPDLGDDFTQIMAARTAEWADFYRHVIPPDTAPEAARVAQLAWAGLIWSKQFYHLVVKDWLDGDPAQPPPPKPRKTGRNCEWRHLFNRDVISMPDKWEYPWYASWDLAFHTVAFAPIDPHFAKGQLELLLREWYMHPNGQIPAYEFAFGDVNPPVHAWAAWRIYRQESKRGAKDLDFLERVFQKLLLNFTWWVNRKDPQGRNLFAGGFLGLDNIGAFDRSQPMPEGTWLAQADGTAWMAFYAARMLTIAIELARHRPPYEDIASKFLEHFIAIADATNAFGDGGLWHDGDGFYYDHLSTVHHTIPLRVRSLVGIIPLFASAIITDDALAALPGFAKRLAWFKRHRPDLGRHLSYLDPSAQPVGEVHGVPRQLLAIPSRDRLERVLQRMVDEQEFLSPFGIRSLSQAHRDAPAIITMSTGEVRVGYVPGESTSGMFGGNSNWRGPIWFPLNLLIIEALERYHAFYGDSLAIEYPARSGNRLTLDLIASDLRRRLTLIFLPDPEGQRPCDGTDRRWADDPRWQGLVRFHEFFHGDNGTGLGASHQTGWTALVATLLCGKAVRSSSG